MKHILEDPAKLEDVYFLAAACKFLEASKAIHLWLREYKGCINKVTEEAEGES